MDGQRKNGGHGRLAAIAAVMLLAAVAGAPTGAQSLDLAIVNQDSNWAAGCGTDAFGVSFCAVQKSNGSRALGYVLEQREGGVDRVVRIAVDSLLIDPASPVTIQVDDNPPMVWTVDFQITDSSVISLAGAAVDTLLGELGTGESVTVTVHLKTGESINFELPLDGFTEAIAALEQNGMSVSN